MYTFGQSEGFLKQVYVPDFGVIRVPKDEVVREAYTTKEYNQLINFSKNWHKAKDIKIDEEKYYRRLINDFIILMANGGFRTQELRLLIDPANK